jgi:uncharacterized membrane protein YdjX (TVP38/TMEM64 family)
MLVERLHAALVSLLTWIGSLGWLGLAGMSLLYVPLAVAALPVWPLTIAVGFFFGVVWAVPIASLGSTLGATTAFLVGRRLGRAAMMRRLGDRPVLAALDRAISRQGFVIVLLVRLSPLLPYNVLNYALALSSVSCRTFVFASWLGMLPVTVMYASIGAAAESLAELLSGQENASSGQVLLIAGAIATVVVALLIARATKKALRELTAE